MPVDELVGESALVETTAANLDAIEPQQETQEQSPEIDQTEEEQRQQPSCSSSTGTGDLPSPETFVNNGLARWLATREAWCRKSSSTSTNNSDEYSSSSTASTARKAVPLDVDGVIDVLFDPRWRGGGGRVKVSPEPPRFPTNVPLPQMIDVLTDLWEAEGLDV